MNLPLLTHDYILTNPSHLDVSPLSIAEFIINKIKIYGNAQAMVNSISGKYFTYNDVIENAIKVGMFLKEKGIQPGDVIGICSENRLEYGPVMLGILAAGATCAPLNPIYNIEELQHVMEISKPSKVFVSPFFVEKLKKIKKQMKFIHELIVFDDFSSDLELTSYSDLLKSLSTDKAYEFPKINVANSVAFLFCSSGTTGLPKCVELTHKNYMCLMTFVGILWSNWESKKPVTMGLIPFFHGYGCCILLESLVNQTLNVILPRFEEENFLASIEKYRITQLFLVPPLLVFLSKHPLVSKYDLSSITNITCGAAPLSKETQVATQKRLNLNFEIHQGYGMTELSICCVAFPKGKSKIGSSGTIAPGMECKVVDLETGKSLPPYKKGELCFRGPFVMKGYRNNAKATLESFGRDGWFHTGDIAYYDDEGFLFIVDRLKELIKYKGYQVAPAELETILLNHPCIKEAGVVGLPDEEAGELPFAFVVKQPGANLSEEDVKRFVAEKVSPQKRLHGGVKFINEIPKNPSGKILRRELRKMLNKSKL